MRGPGTNNKTALCHPERAHKARHMCNACWQRDRRRLNPERVRAEGRTRYARTAEKRRASARNKNQRLKAEVMAAYGGRCACCGEVELAFLSIDHVNGDGHEHRRRVGWGQSVWLDLRRRGYPQDGFRVLCMNCQFGMRAQGGCPHQRRTEGING